MVALLLMRFSHVVTSVNKVAQATKQDKIDVEEELKEDPENFVTKYAKHLTKEERELVSPNAS